MTKVVLIWIYVIVGFDVLSRVEERATRPLAFVEQASTVIAWPQVTVRMLFAIYDAAKGERA